MNTAMRGAGLALTTMIAAGSLAAVRHARPGQGSRWRDDRVEARGTCTGGGTWKLKAKHDDGRIEYEFEVDTNKVGQRWTVKASDNGHPDLLRTPDDEGAQRVVLAGEDDQEPGRNRCHQGQSDPWIEGMLRQGESVDPERRR